MNRLNETYLGCTGLRRILQIFGRFQEHHGLEVHSPPWGQSGLTIHRKTKCRICFRLLEPELIKNNFISDFYKNFNILVKKKFTTIYEIFDSGEGPIHLCNKCPQYLVFLKCITYRFILNADLNFAAENCQHLYLGFDFGKKFDQKSLVQTLNYIEKSDLNVSELKINLEFFS